MRRFINTLKFLAHYIVSNIISTLIIAVIFALFGTGIFGYEVTPLMAHISILLSSAYLVVVYKKDCERILNEIKTVKLTKKDIRNILLGIVVSVCIMILLGFILPRPKTAQFAAEMVKQYPIYGLILSVIIAPIIEETLFRGILLEKSNLITSSVIFGLLHISDFSNGILPALSVPFVTFLLGIYLGKLYKKYNSILPCIITHFGFNLSSSIMLLLFV